MDTNTNTATLEPEAKPKRRPADYHETCIGCQRSYPMSHNGSKHCESGSIASGGKNSHCSCDTCF